MKNFISLLEKLEKFKTLDANIDEFNKWIDTFVSELSPQNLKKIDLIRQNIIVHDEVYPNPYYDSHLLSCIKAIISDEEYKNTVADTRLKDLQIIKIITAREEDFDFEKKIAEVICGDNTNFPYKKGYELTKFFKELGYNYEHDGNTRWRWLEAVLKESNSVQIHRYLVEGVFKRKNFQDSNKDIKQAKEEFNKILEDSCKANELIDISDSFGLNIKNELLFNEKTETKDTTFNHLIDTSKSFFTQGNKQIALEKVWDAFERLKTIWGKKKQVVDILLQNGSILTYDDLNKEFTSLTEIGNNYQIRHFETDKKEITSDIEREYLFFRVLALLNYCITLMQEK